MPAEDIAQQRAQMARELVDEGVDVLAARRRPGDDRPLERDRVGRAGGEGRVLGRRRAERRPPPGKLAGLRTLGLEQGAQAEQDVGERLARRGALAGHLVVAEPPGELARARQPPADEAAERALLVLLVGLEQDQALVGGGAA